LALAVDEQKKIIFAKHRGREYGRKASGRSPIFGRTYAHNRA
jgi:hypothetical protein